MKSIIQEASSIAKAIELGWIKANKPAQFSIKILEEAEKNFFGLTKKSAKIALVFDEQHAEKPRPETTRLRLQERGGMHQQRPARQQAPRMQQQQHHEAPHASSASPHENQQRRQFEPLWTPEMVEKAESWMAATLRSLNKNITYTVSPARFHLRITLSEPIFADREKEKQLLAHFATLILETLKRVGKSGLRGHKIVLTHRQH